MPLRAAAVAGAFYPADADELREMIGSFLRGIGDAGKIERDSSIVVAPHAGYIYSGSTAAHAFSALKQHGTYVIISPNHTGLGEVISVYPEGEWETPLGRVMVDAGLGAKIAKEMGVECDAIAHIQEHSIEVMLPFMQKLFSNFKIVPITIMANNAEVLKKLGDAIHKACGSGGDVGIIASSDFSHFVPLESAKEKDLAAINRIEELDIEGFNKLVGGQRLSICGAAAITVAMHVCRLRGIKAGKLLKYSTSADTTGDKASVVGYAAIKFAGG